MFVGCRSMLDVLSLCKSLCKRTTVLYRRAHRPAALSCGCRGISCGLEECFITIVQSSSDLHVWSEGEYDGNSRVTPRCSTDVFDVSQRSLKLTNVLSCHISVSMFYDLPSLRTLVRVDSSDVTNKCPSNAITFTLLFSTFIPQELFMIYQI